MKRFYQYNVDVAADFDLNLFSFQRAQGQEASPNPGLLALTPPKRAARGREDDHLLVYLILSGNARFSSSEYSQILTKTTQRFYQTSGSITSAIRSAAGELNQSLLNRNLQTTGKGEYIVGRLIMGVLRGTQFVIAQCGPTHVFHLTSSENRQIHDEQIAGRGLGSAQTTQLYFSQIDMHAGDFMVLCPNLPAGWEATLLGERHVSTGTLQRTILSMPGDDMSAVLAQVKAGKGKLNIQKEMQPVMEERVPAVPAPNAPNFSTPIPGANPDAHVRLPSQVDSEHPASRFARLLAGKADSAPAGNPSSQVSPKDSPQNVEKSIPSSEPAGQPTRRPAVLPVAPSGHPVRRTGRFVSAHTTGNLPEIKRPASRQRREIFGGMAKIIQGGRGATQKVSAVIRKFLPNLLPDSNEDSEITGSSMALFAIIIPVIIVAIAATVYIQYGRTAQYRQNYEMALAQAAQARGQTNPTEVRRAWDSTIYYLDLAEKSQKTQDSINVRQEAQTALDNLDGILRLDFRQALIGTLSRSVEISHMAATDTDLYLLDASRGAVMRASMTSQGYEVDPSFDCSPGQYDAITVGALVDLQSLPMSNMYNARVLAMDSKGNLLYCGLAKPVAVTLVPPQQGWRSSFAFSLDADGKNLYVLDPAGSAIWQYSGSLGQFTDLPVMFFGEQVPQNMSNAIDLAANNADLYMLFQDGHVTACPLTHYDVVPIRCSDPATFKDTRPERQPGPKINDAIFTQITFASAPDPSLYLLEPLTRAVYRFSPRSDSLELRGQFRGTMEQNNLLFNGPATAMAISPNRYAFFSVGNQVYFATDVP